MDGSMFDAALRSAVAAPSRRGAIGLVTAAFVSYFSGGTTAARGANATKKKHGKKHHKKKRQAPPCPAGTVACGASCIPAGTCCTGTDCPAGRFCQHGGCFAGCS